MTGAFEVGLFDARGMSDADFMALYRELKGDTFDKIRKDLPLVQRAGGLNLCKDGLVQFLLNRAMSGATTEWPFDQSGTAGGVGMGWINLSTRDNEPTYTEYDGMSTYSGNMHQVSYSANTSSGSKYFLNQGGWTPNEIITHYVYDDPSGREAIWSRSQWLWLPSEGISNNIRSLTTWYCFTADATDHYKADTNRIRLKDSGGTPVIINKTANQVLLVEYIFKQFTV